VSLASPIEGVSRHECCVRTSGRAASEPERANLDPNRSLGVWSGSLKRFSLRILTRRARFERGFDEHPWAFGNDGERFI